MHTEYIDNNIHLNNIKIDDSDITLANLLIELKNCEKCENYENSLDKKKQRRRINYQKNKHKYKIYYQKNKDKIKQYRDTYRLKNKEMLNKKRNEYYKRTKK